MGTWKTSIKGNDITIDIYTAFFDRYNSGEDPILISKDILSEFQEDFNDSDDKHNALFGLVLAQWETKCLDSDLLYKVEEIITNKEDLIIWKALGADDKILLKRQQVLEKFLKQLSTERPKPKRRMKPKFEFSVKNLVKISSPDKNKIFSISEEFSNNEYVHTSGILEWVSGGGSGILYFEGQNEKISAKWLDNNSIEISHNKNLKFTKKEKNSFYCGDDVCIIYNGIYE